MASTQTTRIKITVYNYDLYTLHSFLPCVNSESMAVFLVQYTTSVWAFFGH